MTTLAQLKTWLQSSTSTRVVLVEVQSIPELVTGSNPTGSIYLSNRPYADSANGRLYTACISGGVTFTESISLGGGAPSIGYGDIEIENVPTTDVGPRDTWLTYTWGNKPVKVLIGDVTWTRADFYDIFTGLIKDISSKSRITLNLILTDNMQRLNVAVSNLLLTNFFNSNLSIPLTFGECFNVTPLLINPGTLEYKVHTGQIAEIIEVRDNGAPLSFVANSLQATNLTAGTFTLARTPIGTVTCTVRGAAPSGTHRQYIAETIRHILTGYGNQLSDATYIDSTNFTSFDSTAGTQARCGVFLNQRENVLEVCNRLANSIGAYLIVGLDGKFRLKQVQAVTAGTGTHKLGAVDMEQKTLAIREKVDVRGAVKLAYCKNWTVQSSGLAAGVVQQSATIFARDYYFVNSKDDAVLSNYTQSSEPPPTETLLIEKATAQAECNRLLAMYKTPRFVYSATYYSHLLPVELGDTVDLIHPRFGLSGSGKSGTIVEINRDWLKGRVTLGILI
jgi:hypothetical protein